MNIVIGGGIAGLIYTYYNKDYFLLSDQIGGQMSSYFDLGPRYLHNKSEAVRNFLKDFEIPIKLRTIKVGYIDDNGWVKEPDEEFRKKYFMKSRDSKSLSGFDSSVLNSNEREFEICEVDFRQLVHKIYDRIEKRVYLEPVTKIDLENDIIFTKTMKFNYKNLVTTIPLKVFGRLSGIDLEFLRSITMSYCLMKKDFFDLEKFDYVYDIRENSIQHRMTKCDLGVTCDVISSKLEKFKEKNNVDDYFSTIEKSIVTVNNNQIVSLDKDFMLCEKPNITFFGRYSSWNRKWKTETVIEKSLENSKNLK